MNKNLLLMLIISIGIFISTSNALAVWGSQCATGQESGAQTGCSHQNDTKILTDDCAKLYSGTTCTNMPSYLSALRSECEESRETSVDCAMITQNGFYGREASAFAQLAISDATETDQPQTSSDTYTNPSSNTSSSGTALTLDCKDGMLCIPDDGWGGLSGKSIQVIVTAILKWMLGIIGMIALISFAVSGFQYFLAAGNERAMESAKNNFFYSIIGILAALSGFVIIQAVDAVLNGLNDF